MISARKGEFETGFERGGQTREHAMLAKTAGVKHLVVIINKMDDPTVMWDEERCVCLKFAVFIRTSRISIHGYLKFLAVLQIQGLSKYSLICLNIHRYKECRDKLLPYLKKCGFNPKTDIYFMPVSGITGAFLKDAPGEDICPWYS